MKEMEIGAFEAKNQLSRLLALAEKGQRIYITRRGKRVAVLGPAAEADEQTEEVGATLLERIQGLRRRASGGPESLRVLIEEGRR